MSNVIIRRVLVGVFLMVAVCGLVWAGGARDTVAEVVTLRIGEHPGAHVKPMQDYFIPLYEELTGVKIEMEVLPPDQIWQRFQLDAPQGDWDIGYHSPGWFGYYYEHVADLYPHMQRRGFDPHAAYPASVIGSHGVNELLRPGEFIALPRNPGSPVFAYRKDWFAHPDERSAFRQRYGRDLAPPETWTELYDLAVFFTRPAGATVAGQRLTEPLFGYSASISEPGGMARAFLAVVYSLGLDGFDENYKTDLDHPILLDGVNYWVRLIRDTFPPDASTWNFLEHVDYFSAGRLAMSELWPEAVLVAESGQTKGNVGYAPLPRWEGNLKNLPVGRSFIGMGGVLVFDTPNQAHAYDFLHWLLIENAVEFSKRTASFALKEQFENTEVQTAHEFYREFLPVFQLQMQYAFPRQPVAEWGAVMYTPVGQFAADVLHGIETPEVAQRRLVNNMNQVFRDAGYIR